MLRDAQYFLLDNSSTSTAALFLFFSGKLLYSWVGGYIPKLYREHSQLYRHMQVSGCNVTVVVPRWQQRQFPQELVDHVLGHLPPPSLKTASLVSSSWSASARRYLFREIHIWPGFQPLSAFARMLDESSWHFRSTVELHIFRGFISFSDLIGVISRLTQLQLLKLHLHVDNIPNPLPPLPLPSWSIDTIQFVRLDEEGERPWDVQFYIIRMFHTVQELHIGTGSSEGHDYEGVTNNLSTTSYDHRTKICSLFVSETGEGYDEVTKCLNDLLVRSIDLENLTHLELPAWPASCACEYKSLVRSVSSSLTHFSFDMSEENDERDDSGDVKAAWHDLGLSSCTALQTVRILFNSRLLVFREPTTYLNWHRACDALSAHQTRPTRLPEIILRVCFQSIKEQTCQDHLDSVPWAHVENTILGFDIIPDRVVFQCEWQVVTRHGQRVSEAACLQKVPRLSQRCEVVFEELFCS